MLPRLLSFLTKEKDPLEAALKQARKIKKEKDKLFWKQNKANMLRDKRDNSYLHTGICPACGGEITYSATVDDLYETGNYYKCTVCSYDKHIFWGDEDEYE